MLNAGALQQRSPTPATLLLGNLSQRLLLFAGLAIRVPLINSSITDCVFEVTKDTSVEEVNRLLQVE